MHILRPDDLLPQGEGRWTDETVGHAFAECARALRGHLADPAIRTVAVLVGIPGAGKTSWCAAQPQNDAMVVYDVVNANAGRRARLAARIVGAGKDAVCVWVRCPLSLAFERNARRPPWRRVPEAFMRRAALQLYHQPPRAHEGWTRIEVVDSY